MGTICDFCSNLDTNKDGFFCQCGQPISGFYSIQDSCSYYEPKSICDSCINLTTETYGCYCQKHQSIDGPKAVEFDCNFYESKFD